MPIDAAADLLVAVSKTIRTDAFFALTESLWQRLLRERSFDVFRAAFRACESNLRDLGVDGRLAFTIEILKSAVWVADASWIDQSLALIEENFERIPPHLQFDVDLLDLLRKYVTGRSEPASAHPLRRRIDQAIQDFFTADQATRDRSALECQVLIARDPETVLEAFPLESGEDYSDFYILWNVIAADLAERHAEPQKPVDLSAWLPRGRALYGTIDRLIKGSAIYARWTGATVVYRACLGVSCFFLVLLLTLLGMVFFAPGTPRDDLAVILLVVLVSLGVVLAWWLQVRFVRPRWQKYAAGRATHCYTAISRSELAAFLQRSHFSHQELRELLFTSDISGLQMAQSTADHFQADYALAIYALALRFQV